MGNTETDPHAAYAAQVASRVIDALDAAGITRNTAAELTGIPRETFYRKCRGAGKPFDAVELRAIADAAGVTVSYLMDGAAA